MVSICCLAYNHEEYIAEALESFLMQKCNFTFEILINDDASLDKTSDIIRKYEEKYPDVIKPIYQTENKYSQGYKMFYTYNFSRAIGKYIAICEGDDYWTDEFKLQKQVDFMELNPEFSLCTHAAYMVNFDRELINETTFRSSTSNKIFCEEEAILGGGGLFATNSMFFRRDFVSTVPNFYTITNIEDYPLTILLALCGKIYYIDEFMSAYRTNVIGSWVYNLGNSNKKTEKIISHYKMINEMLLSVDEYSEYKHSTVIQQKIIENNFSIVLEEMDIKKLKSRRYIGFYKNLPIKTKFRIYLMKYFPELFKFIIKVKNYKLLLKSAE